MANKKSHAQIYISIFFIMIGVLFTYVGLDFSRVECENNNCKVYPINWNLVESSPKEITNITRIYIDERYSKKTLLTNVTLQNEDKKLNIFRSHSNMNYGEKKKAYTELNQITDNKNIKINKVYGSKDGMFYIGFFLF